LLSGTKKGTYLIRFSSSEAGTFTLSVMREKLQTEEQMNHYRIVRDIDDLTGKKLITSVEENDTTLTFNGWQESINYFTENVGIKQPKTGSKYSKILDQRQMVETYCMLGTSLSGSLMAAIPEDKFSMIEEFEKSK